MLTIEQLVFLAFAIADVLLFSAAFIRVLNVWLMPEFYVMWILSSQLLWITAFALFVWQYLPMLLKPRIDGRRG